MSSPLSSSSSSSSNANDSIASKSPEMPASQQTDQQNVVHASESDKTCVVCFKIVDIFSIGECDHPVCYECSTRMRVLCKQNECPICRRINQKVIFTSEILPYRELDQKNRSCLYDKTFRICFTGQRAQNAFRRLLEHRCNKCNEGPFDTAVELKEHLRKTHELFYCDICMKHLKIFSFERRAYTREQLAMHRRKGDPDNKSHRGHPLCKYCDERYLDMDELFRHMRKEHYFCHFCDADGANQFYADHNELRDHFIENHFLCQDGECKENIFSAVFRTDIDLKAHKANVHGQTSKQARTIEFQFNLAPRSRLNQENGAAGGMDSESMTNDSTTSYAPPRKVIDAQSEQEFPSLGGGSVPLNIRPTITLNMRSSARGLARTKENFPALGGSSTNGRDSYRPPPPSSNAASHMNASTLLFKTPAAAPSKAASNQSKSNANNNKTKSAQMKTNDFPALPGGPILSSQRSSAPQRTNIENDLVGVPLRLNAAAVSTKHRALAQPALSGGPISNSQRSYASQRANIESDLVEVPLRLNAAAVSAKHRALVQPFEGISLAAATASQKLKTIQRSEEKAPSAAANVHVPSIKSKDSFPALGGGASSSAAAPQWLNATNGGSKKQNQISKKLKVAPAPLLPTSKKTSNDVGNNGSKKDEDAKEKKTKLKANDKKKETAKSTEQSNANANANATNGSANAKKGEKEKTTAKKSATSDDNSKKTKQNNEKNASERNGNNHRDGAPTRSPDTSSQISTTELNGSSTSNGVINSYSSVAHFTMPPPGFPAKTNVEKANVKAPPGFENMPKNNVKNVTTSHTFMSPSNSLQRNNILMSLFVKSLKPPAVDEFINISKLFRRDKCNARAYYEHCEAVLGERFESIFPELLALLPDINKQQELYQTYLEKHDQAKMNELNSYIAVCEYCRQVLKRGDYPEHLKRHAEIDNDNRLNKNFPKLSTMKK